jgi:hypothetical protein
VPFAHLEQLFVPLSRKSQDKALYRDELQHTGIAGEKWR